MLTLLISLLPRREYGRVARNHTFSNIKPRLEGFGRLTKFLSTSTCIGLLFLVVVVVVVGYWPINQALAQEEKKYEVISSSLPEPINLPHPGYISTKFSSFHPGVDIATAFGMPVNPIASGMVDEINLGFFGFGNHLYISHQGGLRSMYAHLGKINVKKGQSVTPATILGEVGLSGHTSGPHTHLEITKDWVYIDPLTILPKIADFPSINKPDTNQNLLPHKQLQPDFN